MKKILIIDDEESGGELAAKVLKLAGFDVVTSDSASTALKYLDEHMGDFEAVLLDLAMPELDGLSLVYNIRLNEQKRELNNKQPIRIAFYTARNKDEATARVMEREGVEKFFAKPLDTPDLGNKVAEWLSECPSDSYKSRTGNIGVQ